MVIISEPNVGQIFEIFESAGFQIRLVGGCVRDAVMGTTPKDYDFATNALPNQIIQVLDANNIRHIEPGWSHGTVSAIIERDMYEITTLRVDAVTDGRHAEVEFTLDWKADARRRDFTMNAMSIDSDGKVYDYFNGLKDIEFGDIRFVGNTRDRIEEDYLRILRLFRFAARGGMKIHDTTLEIVAEYIPKLWEVVSAERIYSELNKTFTSVRENGTTDILEMMDAVGVFGFMNFNWNRVWTIGPVFGETYWGCFVENNVDVDMLAGAMKMDSATRKYLLSCIVMRTSPGQRPYDILKLFFIDKIPMDHINRYFPNEVKPEELIYTWEITEAAQRNGFKGKELGEEIRRLMQEKVNSYKFRF